MTRVYTCDACGRTAAHPDLLGCDRCKGPDWTPPNIEDLANAPDPRADEPAPEV